ncbi:MAG: hypothetical protein HRT90_04805 [Candidatus Margulisbacteria bacterium]|nr:hypothetical protein [Candidatus Margulisiibacteriota bacterium]
MFFTTTKKKLYIVVGVLLISIFLGVSGFYWNTTQDTPDLSKYYLTGDFGKLPRPDGYGKTVDLLHSFYLFDGIAYLRYWSEGDFHVSIPNGIHQLKTYNGSEIEFQTRNGVVDQLKVLSDLKKFKENESVLSNQCKIGKVYTYFYLANDRNAKMFDFTTFYIPNSVKFLERNYVVDFAIIENSRGEKFAIHLIDNGMIKSINDSWGFIIDHEGSKKDPYVDYHLLETQNMQQADIIIDGCKVIKLNLDS